MDSLKDIQNNKDKSNIFCRYMLWSHRDSEGTTEKYILKEEPYEKMSLCTDEVGYVSDGILDCMKDRCNHLLLEKALKDKGFDFFVPLRDASYEIVQEGGKTVVELCYYHNSELYDVMGKNQNGGYIMAPQGKLRMTIEGLYIKYRIDPPFEMKHFKF